MKEYERGFSAGYRAALMDARRDIGVDFAEEDYYAGPRRMREIETLKKKPRKLSTWQKFVKTNSKKPRFKYKTGKRKGMVNMKALAAAWKRKKKR